MGILFTRIQFRRWATTKARTLHLYSLARHLDPGPRVRLWDEVFGPRADSDHGDLGTKQVMLGGVFEVRDYDPSRLAGELTTYEAQVRAGHRAR